MPVANWHTPVVDLDDADPFTLVPARVEEVGVPVELAGDVLFARLVELLECEGELDCEGVVCPIKARPDTSCNACPIAGRYGELCTVGREQESVLTRMAVDGLGE